MNTTPRTDAAEMRYFKTSTSHVDDVWDWARQLERELAAAQGERDAANKYCDTLNDSTDANLLLIEAQIAELAALREDRERLDWLEGNAGDIPKYNSRSFVWFVNQNIRAAIDVSREEAK